jgi:hypothetical protein
VPNDSDELKLKRRPTRAYKVQDGDATETPS